MSIEIQDAFPCEDHLPPSNVPERDPFEEIEEQESKFKPFPYEQFPSPISEYVFQTAESLHCDAAMVGVPMISALASAIGNSCEIEAKSGWTEPAVVWSAIIARPGSMKSIALGAATRFVHERHRKKTEEFQLALQDYDNACIVWETENPKGKSQPAPKPDEPQHERCLVNDSTIEALVEILNLNPRGLLSYRDELSGLFASFGEYKSKNSSDVASYLAMFRAESITTDRKSNDSVRFVPRAAVSITGSIQPDILRRCLAGENTENGLASRFLLCEPPVKPKQWTDEEVDPFLIGRVEELFQQLFDIPCDDKPVKYPLSPTARKRFKRFVNEHGQDTHNSKGAVEAAFSKLEAYCLRFALIFHIIDQVQGRIDGDETVIHEDNLERAIQLVEWFKWETQRVYKSLQGLKDESLDLVKLIRDKFDGEISSEELRKAKTKYRGAGAAQKALEELQRQQLGRFHTVETGGRPKSLFRLKCSH